MTFLQLKAHRAWFAVQRYFVLLTAAVLLSGCADLPFVKRVEPANVDYSLPRAAISAFDLQGRLAVQQGQDGWQAGVQWMHSAIRDEIVLSGPFGQTMATLVRDAQGARLTAGDRHIERDTLDALAEHVFGRSLPLVDMQDWVLGRPSGATSAVQRDAFGRAVHWQKQAWTVDVLSYQDEQSEALPRVIQLIAPAEAGLPAATLRLRVDEWSLNSSNKTPPAAAAEHANQP